MGTNDDVASAVVPPGERNGTPEPNLNTGGGAPGSHEGQWRAGGDDDPDSAVEGRPILWTTLGCLLFAVGGHAMLWVAYARHWGTKAPWQPIAGISIIGVAVIAFGGFYVASRRARVAIAASFLLSFLLMLTFAVTIDRFADGLSETATELLRDYRVVIQTIVGFYFSSEAVVSAAKVIATSRTGTAAQIRRADRDLPPSRRR